MHLSAVVRDRNMVLFMGDANAVSSFNDQGPFDVLPMHENFITIITKEVIIYPPQGKEKHIPVASGVMMVNQNAVEVYIGILERSKY